MRASLPQPSSSGEPRCTHTLSNARQVVVVAAHDDDRAVSPGARPGRRRVSRRSDSRRGSGGPRCDRRTSIHARRCAGAPRPAPRWTCTRPVASMRPSSNGNRAVRSELSEDRHRGPRLPSNQGNVDAVDRPLAIESTSSRSAMLNSQSRRPRSSCGRRRARPPDLPTVPGAGSASCDRERARRCCRRGRRCRRR